MEFYTPKEAGAIINKNEDTICDWIKKGKISAINTNKDGVKGRYLIPVEEFNNWLTGCRSAQRQIYKNIDW